jgi:hypothetical protein
MNSQVDTDSSALGPGADLWIAPDRSQSTWAARVDWYLNFQTARAEKHRPLPVPQPVLDILNRCELRNYDWQGEDKTDNSILIWASPFVPARWVLTLPDSGDLDNWMTQAVRKWKSLQKPSVRIFLPRGASVAQCKSLWVKVGGPDTLQLIADPGASSNG